jgi:hypothetical protein
MDLEGACSYIALETHCHDGLRIDLPNAAVKGRTGGTGKVKTGLRYERVKENRETTGDRETNPESKAGNIRHDSEGQDAGRRKDLKRTRGRQGRRRGAEGKEVAGTLYIYIC